MSIHRVAHLLRLGRCKTLPVVLPDYMQGWWGGLGGFRLQVCSYLRPEGEVAYLLHQGSIIDIRVSGVVTSKRWIKKPSTCFTNFRLLTNFDFSRNYCALPIHISFPIWADIDFSSNFVNIFRNHIPFRKIETTVQCRVSNIRDGPKLELSREPQTF